MARSCSSSFKEDYFTALTRLLAAQQRGELEHHGAEAELMLGGLYLSYGQHRLAGEIFERVLQQSVEPALHDRAWFFLAKIWQQRGYLERGRGGARAHRRRAARGARARAADALCAGAHGARPLCRGVDGARVVAQAGRRLGRLREVQHRRGARAARPDRGRRARARRSRSARPREPRIRCAARQGQRRARLRVAASIAARRGEAVAAARAARMGRSRTKRCSASAGPTQKVRITVRRWRRGWRCAIAACSTRPCRNRCWPCRTRSRSSAPTSKPPITTSTRSTRSAARSCGSRARSRASRTAS